jgi:hypothetical protein
MRRPARLLGVIAGLTAVLAAGVASVAPKAGAGGPIGAACSVERAAIKTLRDRPRLLARRVTTVRYLVTRRAPSQLPNSTRLPFERHVFTVVAAVTRLRQERDSDLRLTLKEGAYRMIAEAPAPECDRGATSKLRKEMATARGAARLCKRARVTGVAYFDPKNGQEHVGQNGIELHPILGFRCLRR